MADKPNVPKMAALDAHIDQFVAENTGAPTTPAAQAVPSAPPPPTAQAAPPAPPPPMPLAAPPAPPPAPAKASGPADFQASMRAVEAGQPPAAPVPEPEDPKELESDPKAKNAWTRKNQRIAELERAERAREAEIAKLQQELLDAKRPDPRLSEEAERLRQKIAEYEGTIAKVDLEASPSFRAKYDDVIDGFRNESLSFAASLSLNA